MMDWDHQSDIALEALLRNRNSEAFTHLLEWLTAECEKAKDALCQQPPDREGSERYDLYKAVVLAMLIKTLNSE